jgi:hypothetical protein
MEEHRPRIFENRALRTMFGPRRDEVTGDWRKLHNEELHNFAKCNQNDQVKRGQMGRNLARMGRR